MDRRDFLRVLGCAAAGAALPGAVGVAAEAARARLNFVFILIDDLGWTDVACNGSAFYETAGVDRLARMGMRFTNGYAACTVCSPTRASILTGKYPARLHLTDWIAGHKRPYAKLRIPDWTQHLPHEEVTFAEVLKRAGYATALVGKWHLGPKEYFPESQGFDVNIGGCERGQPPSYFSPYGIATMPDGLKGEYLTDRHAQDCEAFLEQHKDTPFLLYLAQYAVHTPLQAKDELVAKYKGKAASQPGYPQKNATYAAMVQSMAECVERVIAKLERLELLERTVIMFVGDNGGLIGGARNPVTHNIGVRAGKGSAYEGGVRVPFIVYWPGVTAPGSVCEVPVITCDFYPTFLAMAGLAGDPAHNANVDGESLVPLLRGAGKLARDAIYWHYPHYHPGGATPYSAVRAGDSKLIEFFEDERVELYNLREDQAETRDLAAAMPEKAAALRAQLRAWRTRVGAQLPTTNPAYDPAKDK